MPDEEASEAILADEKEREMIIIYRAVNRSMEHFMSSDHFVLAEEQKTLYSFVVLVTQVYLRCFI